MANKLNQTKEFSLGEILSFAILACGGGALSVHFFGKSVQEIPTYVAVIVILSCLVGSLIASSKNNWTGFCMGIVLFLCAAISIGFGVDMDTSAVEQLKSAGDPNDLMTRIGKASYFCATTVVPLLGSFLMIVFPYIGKK